jgi:hypothetical protein
MSDRVQIGESRKVKDAVLEARYTDGIKANKALKACCRNVDTSAVSLWKTHADAKTPDMMIIECDVCKRKQYRTAVGPGRIGG